MKLIKILFCNILILFSFFGILLLLPPLVGTIYLKFKNMSDNLENIEIANFPNYIGQNWVQKHFKELKKLNTEYNDFIVWRRKDFKGATINITDGLRHTYVSENLTFDNEYWVFGGSAIFGMGSNDYGTLPSVIAKKTNRKVINFGESGYIARQSLALLNDRYIRENSKIKKIVLFYDGVNDVGSRCLKENDGYSTIRENQINNYLYDVNNKWSIRRTFKQLEEFLSTVIKKVNYSDINYSESFYICHLDIQRAKKVARTLVNTWKQAQSISHKNGDYFLAILQPSAFLGNPQTDHLNMQESLYLIRKKQIETVYPLIIEQAKNIGLNFIDLSQVFDGNNYYFIDPVHVSPNAHIIIADKILDKLDNK